MSDTSLIGSESFHAAAGAAALGRDFCAGILRLKGIANPHGNSRLITARSVLGMENLGAKIGELGSLTIGNFGDRSSIGNETRVGAQDAIDIGPDNDSSAPSAPPRIVAE